MALLLFYFFLLLFWTFPPAPVLFSGAMGMTILCFVLFYCITRYDFFFTSFLFFNKFGQIFFFFWLFVTFCFNWQHFISPHFHFSIAKKPSRLACSNQKLLMQEVSRAALKPTTGSINNIILHFIQNCASGRKSLVKQCLEYICYFFSNPYQVEPS